MVYHNSHERLLNGVKSLIKKIESRYEEEVELKDIFETAKNLRDFNDTVCDVEYLHGEIENCLVDIEDGANDLFEDCYGSILEDLLELLSDYETAKSLGE